MVRDLTIRGFTPAAPLKRSSSICALISFVCYPRVHTRGPIEAGKYQEGSFNSMELSAGSHPRPH